MTTRTSLAACTAALALVAPAPALADPIGDVDGTPVSITEELADAIDERFDGNAIGYAWALAKDGKPVDADAGGDARRPQDGGRVAFTTSTRMEIWSSTKNVAAVATLKALQEAGVSVDAPVKPWLPKTWRGGNGFNAGSAPVTFRQLLTHTSGIDQRLQGLSAADRQDIGNDWDGAREIVRLGTSSNRGAAYKNMNYLLLRITVPNLWKKAAPSETTGPVTRDNSWKRMVSFVNKRVLKPAGVAYADCQPTGDRSKAALHYDFSQPSGAGAFVELTGNGSHACAGHRGLHLSAGDLVRIATFTAYDKILPKAWRKAMDDGRLGWDAGSNAGGRIGFWWHGGDGFIDQTVAGAGREGHSCITKLPAGYTAAAIVNSDIAGAGNVCFELRQAWDQAQPGA